MKAITLHQPYASLIALGLKKFETRSWKTSAPTNLVIHAAKRPPKDQEFYQWAYILELAQEAGLLPIDKAFPFFHDLPLGVAVAVCRVRRCQKMTMNIVEGRKSENINIDHASELEQAVGEWKAGRYAWELRDVIALPEPIPAQGKQGLWEFPHPEILPELPPFVPAGLFVRSGNHA